MVRIRFVVVTAAFALALGFFGCGDDDDEKDQGGSPIGAPQIQPPVDRNTPAGFATAALRLQQDLDTAEARILFEVGRYLRPAEGDAVGVLERLAAIDNRMTELDTRHQDNARDCLAETPTAYTLAADLPGSDAYSASLQCQENLDDGDGSAESAQLAFGITDASFFLFERTGNFDNAVLAIGDMDGTGTEFWQLGTGENQNYIHVVADDSSGMELTSAGTQAGGVLDCGTHMKSNGTLMYIVAFDGVGGECAAEATTLCVSATDLTTSDVTECESAGLNTFALDTLTRAEATTISAADTIIHTPITGYTDFNTSSEEDEPSDQ